MCATARDAAQINSRSHRPPPVQQGLYRIAALLAMLIADELMVLGDVGQSTAWHATARFAADQTNDIALQADTRTFAALVPLYYGDAYEAVGLAQLGAIDASEAALSHARRQVAALDARYQAESVFGFLSVVGGSTKAKC